MESSEQIQLPQSEILAQIAEEASELSQAALKLRRAITKTNPTPVGTAEAANLLEEEYADVQLCVEQLSEIYRPREAVVRVWKATKLKRWKERLEGWRNDHKRNVREAAANRMQYANAGAQSSGLAVPRRGGGQTG